MQCIMSSTAKKEEPPLLCSLDGHYSFPYPVQMCSYIIFLSATIDVDSGKVRPLAGTEAQYLAFKDANKTGELKKLLSFRYDDVSSRAADEINAGFVKVRSKVFHGIDIRITEFDPTWLKLLTDLRLLADQNGYLIHVVFDVPVGMEISQVHMATLRVYKPLSQGPYRASPIQTLTQIEQAVDKYSKEVLLSGAGQLASSAWHCVGLSLAAVAFQSTGDLEDEAVGIKRLSYCDFNRNNSKKIPFDVSYYTTSYKNDLVVFEQDKEFTEKLKAITKLSKSCVLLDHVYYDYHHCECDQPNFKLLRATRRVLWGSSARQY
ncbi:uncharacterized protein [Dermacentor andersoni]|uniref:uncharacterized protein n=1 Tax=Dermacentor andersoni TaxID=34620 RepID=UPI002416BB15|nr:uncharacterized protein LOC129386281 [Dermacentor andersoni]